MFGPGYMAINVVLLLLSDFQATKLFILQPIVVTFID